jgi:hypothetical protein
MMGEVACSTRQEPERSVQIVVHVGEALGEAKCKALVHAVEKNEGIVLAEFCPLRYHLMRVRYDRDVFNSRDVLGKVNEPNVHAVLIGPVQDNPARAPRARVRGASILATLPRW